MALPLARSERNTLSWRVVSAVVMMPAAVGVVWLGSWIFVVGAAVFGGLMYWEWQGFCESGSHGASISRTAGIAGCVAGPLLVPLLSVGGAVAAWVALSVFFTVLVVVGRRPHPAFLGAGFAFILAGVMLMIWIRVAPADGLVTMFWILLLVSATDTGGYFAGRTIGGPKLAPRVSPKKTWAGLIGGMAAAALVGAGVAVAIGRDGVIAVALVSAGLAVVAQAGDLIVSKAKRKFGVKDSSDLIPGHGGLLDRLDGYLTVMPTVALIFWLGGGSPLSWL
jgi:phosphatidate cytidylyltransferase